MAKKNNLDPNETPSVLRPVTPAPKRGPGVKKVNRIPLIIGISVGSVVLGTVLYTAHHKAANNAASTALTDQTDATATSGDVPEAQFRHPSHIAIRGPKLPDGKANPNGQELASATPPASVPGPLPGQQQTNPYAQQWAQYTQQQEQLREQRAQELTQALRDGSEGRDSGDVDSLYKAVATAKATGGANGGGTGQNPTDSDYLGAYRTGARNALEVKEGTAIPATLIGGVNSDVPGMIKAQVKENVYDGATGETVLIPQGSYIIGNFNRVAAYGQTRIEVAFTRIIFPDQSSIDLGQMEGADMGGNAGFEDQVNNHWMRVWGNALLAAAFSSAIQLSQSSNSLGGGSNTNGYSAQQIIAAQTGQQMGEVGMEIARRGLNIPPTITIRPGYEFNVLVRKDMVLPAYQDRWGNGTLHQVAVRK